MTDNTRRSVRINKGFVKYLLSEQGMSLLDLAGKCDIGQATLYRIVNEGAIFKSDTLARLADALRCSPADLIDVREFAPPLMDAPAIAVNASGRN